VLTVVKPPSPQHVSRVLRAAGFDRSEVLSRATLNHRCTAGFHVRASDIEVYVSWRPKTPLLTPSAAQRDRDKATALEMAGKYAEAVTAAGWAAEIIDLAGPVVRVTARED
jgi:hypothetical protein